MAGGAGGGRGRGPRAGAPPWRGAWASARPSDVGLRAWEGRACPVVLGGAHLGPPARSSQPGLCGPSALRGAGGWGPRPQSSWGRARLGRGSAERGSAGERAPALCAFSLAI